MEEFIGSVTVLKTGHSHRITIPAKIIKEMNIKPGDKLLVYLDKERKRIIFKPPA